MDALEIKPSARFGSDIEIDSFQMLGLINTISKLAESDPLECPLLATVAECFEWYLQLIQWKSAKATRS